MSILRMTGDVDSLRFAIAAPAIWLSQHVFVAAVFTVLGIAWIPSFEFWMLPIRELTLMPGVPLWIASIAFAFNLLVSGALAALAYRRAQWSDAGYVLTPFVIIPGIQVFALAVFPLIPRRDQDEGRTKGLRTASLLQGVVAGIAIIVLAVLISAVVFGAYGWGLFVATPFTVGIATAYIANRQTVLSVGQTTTLVLAAAATGTLALVMFALEGLLCIVLAAPLGALVAALGGLLGRGAARAGKSRSMPLMSVSLLPVIFMLEAGMPPSVTIQVERSALISAQPAAVWSAITSGATIQIPPGLVDAMDMAYPLRSELIGEGVGARRIGHFSTGLAEERVTEWVPGKRLSFMVLTQPPAMDEMSPYRKVHAPHTTGYFETGETRFDLQPLGNGTTRLTITSIHALRMDPALYWEPLARLAIHMNLSRVLADIEAKAGRANTSR